MSRGVFKRWTFNRRGRLRELLSRYGYNPAFIVRTWGLHWALDIAFREDDNRVRDINKATNLAILRKFTLSLCKQENTAR